jgi:3'5'-cyclic nucleotide phosphodiesterase
LKLISRIVSPLESLSKQFGSERRLNASKLYDHTFGLTSDPLTLFACAFSALIQSVDHPGVPNAVLVNEDGDLAKKYGGQSIAEQNSVEVAWNLLMADKYSDLRASIFPTSSEQNHFRQIVIHSVMATDMLDPKLKAMRNQQWKQTFGGNQAQNRRTMSRDIDNRKATIVIEHLMQTSSIAHTMQHVSSKCRNKSRTKRLSRSIIAQHNLSSFIQWHIYRKWSEKLYREILVAFLIGRTEYDPSVDWFEREIQFFDFTVIPLARKLKECGVFGVSGHEYLNYAMNNRKAWEIHGKEIVAEMSARCKSEIMVEIMKHMKGNSENPGSQQQLQCAISDQFGPDSLLLTSSWSKENHQSTDLLGALLPTLDQDDDESDGMTPWSPQPTKRTRTIPL